MPRGFTEQEKVNIRNRLLLAGKESFGLYGIKKTSVEDLAKKSGISKGAFYQFFKSKEDLYFHIIRMYEDKIQKGIFDDLSHSTESNRTQLKSVMVQILKEVDSDPFAKRLLRKEEFDYLWQKFTPEQFNEAMQTDWDFASQLINIWKERGKLKISDPKVIAGVFRGIFFLNLHKEDIGEEVFSEVLNVLLDSAIEKLIDN